MTEMIRVHPDDVELSQRIWRYMDLPRYASLLSHGAVFFASPDRLGDPQEGRPSPNQVRKELAKAELVRQPKGDAIRSFQRGWTDRQLKIGVSCWHAKDEESAMLWDVYAGQRAGVAIVSTVERVRQALPDRAIKFAQVSYRDYDERPDNLSPYQALCYKLRAHEDEREVRFFVDLTDQQVGAMQMLRILGERRQLDRHIFAHDGSDPATPVIAVLQSGVLVHVDLRRLIESVVIAPGFGTLFYDAVVAVTASSDLPEGVLRVSELDVNPYELG